MSDQEKVEFAREEAARIIKDTFSNVLETKHIVKVHKMFPAMFNGGSTDKDALKFFGWLEVEYADCF